MLVERGRRRFLTQLGLAGVAGLGGLAGARLTGGGRSFAADPPPEITRITLGKGRATCIAPQYVAGELLQAEGFTDTRYRVIDEAPALAVAHHQLDWDMDFAPEIIAAVDNREALTAVAATHVGCMSSLRITTFAALPA
jgi:NitT/TauT family transport system substrate-binding protein